MGLSGVKLDELQGDFAGLVLAGETSEAISVAGRLPLDRADLWRCSIYRSHYANASADALAASYPAIARYLGTSRFRDLAVAFARQCPPAQAALCMFGGGFEVFLADQIRGGAGLPLWLGELAAMEWAVQASYFAEDAAILDQNGLAELIQQRADPAACRFQLHPATHLVSFGHCGLHAYAAGHADADAICLGREAVVIARNDEGVARYLAEGAELAFLRACGDGKLVGQAFALALAHDDACDPAQLLGQNCARGVFMRS